MAIDALKIIQKYYIPDTSSYNILVGHGRLVALTALEIAGHVKHLNPDLLFLEEAAMLHDIGIFLTNEPGIGCYGDMPYICHGYLGRELLEKEGLPVHALVCERHVGVGLSAGEIEIQGLPIPRRDMLPVSVEEKIICYADKFFSKKTNSHTGANSLGAVRRNIERYGKAQLIRFDELHAMFSR